MPDTYAQDDDPNLLMRLFDAASGFVRAPGYAYGGRYAPPVAQPGVLTEDDAFRQNYARDREVLDALQMGWYGPRGGGVGSRLAVDYAPSRLTKGAERDAPRKSIFENATGIFPEFDAAAPKSGLRSMLSNYFGTPAKREERRSRPAQVIGGIDPQTGERFQTWPERLVRSAVTLPGDVAAGRVPATELDPVTGEFLPSNEMMERAQDLAGIMGGGPLTQPRSAATLGSGARRPPNVGESGMTRRGLFDAFRNKEAPVAEPRAPLDVGQNAPAPQLPAVQDPLARLMQGPGELPVNNRLLDQLTTPPAMPHAELTERLAKALNPDVDRRALLRGAGSAVAAGSRAMKVADALTAKPAEVVAPKEVLPKFEEVWKRGEAKEFINSDDYSDMLGDATDKAMRKQHGKNWEEKIGYDDPRYQAMEDKIASEMDVLPEHLEGMEDSSPRYSDFQLPGGENYRELLIKHPETNKDAVFKVFDKVNKHVGSNLLDDRTYKESNLEGLGNTWQDKGVLSKQEADVLRNAASHNRNDLFYSGSWDEPNVLGHIRMHDRDIPGVGKALHLEELNSEWHQEGAQKGYQSDLDKEFEGFRAVPGNKPGSFDVLDSEGKVIDRLINQKSAEEALETTKKLANNTSFGRVPPPDAPLKDTWPDYLLRRAIKEAVDSGHDAISWTPGEHQAGRYDLDQVSPEKGRQLQKLWNDRRNELKGQLGREPTRAELDADSRLKNIDQAIVKARTSPVHEFYDKHLVDRANEIGKQYGTKVEKRPLGFKKEDTSGLPPDMDESYFPAAKRVTKLESGEIPVLRITPQLRKAVKDGSFSLLSDSGKPGAALAALENAPHFYSAVERAVSNAKLNKAAPEQWLGYLRNQPGVRQEELQHLRLDQLKGKQLSKEEINKHITENAPKLEETWKKGSDFDDFMSSDARIGNTPPSSKYSEYQLPGGENYRELLMQLPEAKPKAVEDFNNFKRQLELKYNTHVDSAYDASKISGDNAVADKYEALLKNAQEAQRGIGGKNYRSSHWDEPNVLGHVRMNDRQVPGVGKALHLEELQSDWHQAGRKHGYRIANPEFVLEGNGPWVVREKNSGLMVNDYSNKQMAEAGLRAYNEQPSRWEQFGAPNAPFKQTWPDLLLKRSLREAVDNGYDAISWTPGEKQAERYDLSHHYSDIRIERGAKGNYSINGKYKSVGFGERLATNVNESQLADYVGKDLAEKIVNDKIGLGGTKSYSGLDLKVGGEGMHAFYDKMLVDKANALGKKYGAKVEWKDVGGSPYSNLKVVASSSGRPNLRDVVNDVPGALPVIRNIDASSAEKYVKDNAPIKVPVLKLTPEFKAAIKKGFPLFSAALPFGALDEGKSRK